jgi:hypothetical protein
MASAIFHHSMTAAQTQAAQTATTFDTTTQSTGNAKAADDSSASSGSATISGNDFLTLLVTEMQNQDPTADTDPNEYINQLVQVNSLEQLIDINQTLSGDVSGSSNSSPSETASSSSSTVNEISKAVGGNPAGGDQTSLSTLSPPAWSSVSQSTQTMPIGHGPSVGKSSNWSQGAQARHAQSTPIAGNLAIGKTNPSATGVGHALSGRTHRASAVPTPKGN